MQGAYALVRGDSSTSNLLEPSQNHIITETARCVEFCDVSSGWFDCTKPSLSTSLQGKQSVQGAYALVRSDSSTSNHRRTFSNHIIIEIARCVEFCHMSSGWFDRTEPSLSTSLQGKQGMQGAYALVRGGSSTSNLIESSQNHIITEIGRCVEFCHMSSGWFDCSRTFSIYIVAGETRCAGCLCTCSGCFKHIEPYRTFSNHIITETARCVEFCDVSSGWFDCTEPSLSTGETKCTGCFCQTSSGWFDSTEPSLSTSLQGKQGVQGAYALVLVGSSTSNLVEPSRTTSL